MTRNKIKEYIKEGLMLVLGALLYAVAVEIFLSPLKISPGGVAGIAAALNYLTAVSTGLLIIIFNVPLILIGVFKLGTKFMLKTVLSVFLASAFIDLIQRYIALNLTDKVVCSVFGGLLMGLGLSIVMLAGASTGGADIAVKIINNKFGISIGRAFLLIDGFVIAFAAIVYSDVQSALYSVIAVLASSKTIDLILYGNSDSKAIFIITSYKDKLTHALLNNEGRGVTLIKAKGGFTDLDCHMLLCVARNNEINRLRSTIKKVDSKAFFFIVSAGDVVGKGFQS